MSKYYASFEKAKDVTVASQEFEPIDETSASFRPSSTTGTTVINASGETPSETAGAGAVVTENVPVSDSETEQTIRYLSQKKVKIRDYKLKK